jgi:hypothetical protein
MKALGHLPRWHSIDFSEEEIGLGLDGAVRSQNPFRSEAEERV